MNDRTSASTPVARTTAKPAAKHAPRAKRAPFVLLMLGLIAGGMCALLGLNTASAANELQRHALADQDESIAANVVQLQNQVAASAAPGNLANAAGALGMVPAGNPAFLVVDANGKVVLRGSPAPVTGAPVYVAPKKKTAKTAKKKASTAKKKVAKKPVKKTTSRTPAKSTSKSVSKSAATSTSTTRAAKKTTAKKTAPKRTTPKTPSPTPTPNTTLPGGNR